MVWNEDQLPALAKILNLRQSKKDIQKTLVNFNTA